MCDKCPGLPPEGADPSEVLEAAMEQGWIPAFIALVKQKENGEVDLKHVHYLLRVSDPTAMQLVLGIAEELEKSMLEGMMRHARRN